jgi:hypothetical protein
MLLMLESLARALALQFTCLFQALQRGVIGGASRTVRCLIRTYSMPHWESCKVL